MWSEGSSRSEPARRGRLSLLTFFGEAKKVSRLRRDKAQRQTHHQCLPKHS
ncbi:hypothetical protein GCWU000324_02219 [Kingella oralis ATCC 51147]|uniref:Uncharacterized protein n=1 Tax=Kingella oralis ATCC 51147 TaxID=629741 RepID=C4GJJ6_9NEIS|nr:hypothetical protein GCWU000324_02219 [Kingella oralis ATCC 51147]